MYCRGSSCDSHVMVGVMVGGARVVALSAAATGHAVYPAVHMILKMFAGCWSRVQLVRRQL